MLEPYRPHGRLHPNVVVRQISPNQSTRTAGISAIVLHDTEGHNVPKSSADLAAIGELFGESSREASAHVCTDSDGNSGRYVADLAKAWHCVSYNSATLGIEQLGFASQNRREWGANWRELHETARWIAQWSLHYKIPIRRAHVGGGEVYRSGVTRHMDLGYLGGGHTDPGPDYPFRRVLWLARGYKAARRLRRK